VSSYDERTERWWFVLDRRGFHHLCRDEEEACRERADNPNVVQALYRDVTFGPMVEVDR
jgi:hypothetical protein